MVDSLRAQAQAAAEATGAEVAVDVIRGRPADALMELGEQVDLLVDRLAALGSGNPGDDGKHRAKACSMTRAARCWWCRAQAPPADEPPVWRRRPSYRGTERESVDARSGLRVATDGDLRARAV